MIEKWFGVKGVVCNSYINLRRTRQMKSKITPIDQDGNAKYSNLYGKGAGGFGAGGYSYSSPSSLPTGKGASGTENVFAMFGHRYTGRGIDACTI